MEIVQAASNKQVLTVMYKATILTLPSFCNTVGLADGFAAGTNPRSPGLYCSSGIVVTTDGVLKSISLLSIILT